MSYGCNGSVVGNNEMRVKSAVIASAVFNSNGKCDFFNSAIDVSAANSTTGLSGQSVDLVASASTGELFKIINISPFENLTGSYSQGVTGGGTNNGVEVKWNYHFLHAPTAAI